MMIATFVLFASPIALLWLQARRDLATARARYRPPPLQPGDEWGHERRPLHELPAAPSGVSTAPADRRRLARYSGDAVAIGRMVHFPMLAPSGPMFCRITHDALAVIDGSRRRLSDEVALATFLRHRTSVEAVAHRLFLDGHQDVIVTPDRLARSG